VSELVMGFQSHLGVVGEWAKRAQRDEVHGGAQPRCTVLAQRDARLRTARVLRSPRQPRPASRLCQLMERCSDGGEDHGAEEAFMGHE